MEELVTTEVLDREILEDARKKAFKILKTADETIAAKEREWEKKTSLDLESIRKNYAGRIKKAQDEITARLPLDMRRLRSETAEGCLKKAINNFLVSLEREKLLAIVANELLERFKVCMRNGDFSYGGAANGGAAMDGKGSALNRPRLSFSAMSSGEIKGLLEKVIGSLQKEDSDPASFWHFEDFELQNTEPADKGDFPSVVVNMRGIKITASVAAAADSLMREKRSELASALLGKEVLDD